MKPPKPDEEFLSPTICTTCSMALPMAGGRPMAEACLKCFPNGPVKQKKAMGMYEDKPDAAPGKKGKKKAPPPPAKDDDDEDKDDGDDDSEE